MTLKSERQVFRTETEFAQIHRYIFVALLIFKATKNIKTHSTSKKRNRRCAGMGLEPGSFFTNDGRTLRAARLMSYIDPLQ